MDEIKIKKENILNAYKNASNEQKEILEHLFGSEVFKPTDIRDRIKTFADAAKAVGIEDPKEWEENYSDVEPDILAYFKLRIITKALNEGWEPKFIEEEKRWMPYFILYSKKKINRLNAKAKAFVVYCSNSHGGVLYASANYDSSITYTSTGSHLFFKSKELAEYAGKRFAKIYADFLL